MTTRITSSSSSSSEVEVVSGRSREISETSRDTTQTGSRLRQASPTNTIDGTSIADTTARSASPSASHASSSANRTTYDSASITTTVNTNATGASQQPLQIVGGIPIIRPPVLQQQQPTGTGIGVFGPQRSGGPPIQQHAAGTNVVHQQPIQIDVAAAQQQYQQRGGHQDISPDSGSSTSSSGGSLSSPGTASLQQQPRFDAAKAIFNQVDANKDGRISQQEFRQWAAQGGAQQGGAQFHQQQQQQQAQFANQIPAHQVYNELLGPDAFKDVILDIDYGAMGGLNAAFQSGGDFSGGQLPPGISIRPAYTNVDSLNYQQHMFNTARTVHAGGENSSFDYSGASGAYDVSGGNSAYNVSGGGSSAYDVSGASGQNFDVTKAIFNQADVNHDGRISRDEFRQWAQGGQGNYAQQSYSTTANYQDNTANYGGNNTGLLHASLLDGANPAVANILQQSGLGQVVPN